MVRALLIAATIAGCVRSGGSYRCAGDAECTLGGAAGVCESTGFCSFPDPDCDSGYRYGEHAGTFANSCADPAVSTAVTIGGTVGNLVGTNLVLRNNGGDDLLVTMNGPFTFGDTVMTGVPYEVTVAAQPSNPSQTCSVAMGSGTAGSTDVTDVEVNCDTTTYSIGGTVIGLDSNATGLVLTNNSGDDRTISANGAFTFATSLASGTSFDVDIKTQPSGDTCTVSGGTGTVGAANVTSVVVNCNAGTYTVGGTVSGLEGSVVLRNNDNENATVSANGTFAFPTPLATTAPYSVVVQTQPSYPPRSQTCVVTNGSGSIGTMDITSISVACTTNTFTVGGTIAGLTGTLVLSNGADTVSVTAASMFTFPTAVPSGNTYNVQVMTQPSGQTCSITANATGTVANGNITDVTIACGAAGADPGILCGTFYCDPAASEICCIEGGVPSCTTSCSGGSKTPIRCDSQADCAAAGTPALVCCGSVTGTTVNNIYCGGQMQCTSPDAFYCDPNVANPCPNGGTCTPTMYPFPGYYRCF